MTAHNILMFRLYIVEVLIFNIQSMKVISVFFKQYSYFNDMFLSLP